MTKPVAFLAVETGFVDDCLIRVAGGSDVKRDGILIHGIDMVIKCIFCVAITKYLGHILTNELKKQPKWMCRILVYI